MMEVPLLKSARTLVYSVLVAVFSGFCLNAAASDPGSISVNVDRPGVTIGPMLYGLMTEEINHSYDGGIYAELIQNRCFKDNSESPVHWSVVATENSEGRIELDSAGGATATLDKALRLTVTKASQENRVGAANDGYWGIPVRPFTTYRISVYARCSNDFRGPLTAALESNDGKTNYASARLNGLSSHYKQINASFTTGACTASTENRFVIYVNSPGTVWLSQVSLFPPTFKNRPNGNRIDLMQMLGNMNPAFLRLPGGNYLEGDTFQERFDWKKTIHNIAERPGHRGPWGYRSTDGMGLLEYLEWCEDLKMEPLLAVFAGYVLRGQHVEPGATLQPYVDEALEEIEYVSGGANTKWGAERARDGHPQPFKLQYVEIGNEDLFDRSGSYDGRFAQFFDAIRAKYPTLKIIATTPVRMRVPDVVDDHYYRSAADMERDVHHYDSYSRTGPKIFVGEWASTEGSPTPTLQAALGDAAWMTGMERNSDLIPISCYAPLLVNVNKNASQWGTNLIGYDALTSFGSPSYYIQSMFAKNRGDVTLPVTLRAQPVMKTAPAPRPQGGVGVGTWATAAEYRNIRVTESGAKLLTSENGTGDWQTDKGKWTTDGGVLTQSAMDTDCRATSGDSGWHDYTYSLQARKTSGNEGFLILFHVKDSSNYIWWNIGGWGNTRSALERARDGAKHEIGRATDTKVETGKWYNIRIELKGTNIKCYFDGALVSEAEDLPDSGKVDPLYAAASRDHASGDVILKVVNVSASLEELQVNLETLGHAVSGSLQVIQGNPGDVNTVAHPDRVVPQVLPLRSVSEHFLHSFPPHSVTIMRINVKSK